MHKFLLLGLGIFIGLVANSQTWQTVSNLPISALERHHPCTFTIDGIGYLMGGASATSTSYGDFYSYDPLLDTWTTKADFPGLSRGYSYAVNSDTKGYVGFGLHNDPGAGTSSYLFDFWEYDPLTDVWTELTPFPGISRVHPAMVELDGKIYMGLGASESSDLGDWWEYDIASDTWTELTTFPGSNRHHPYFFAFDGYVYVGMGHAGPVIHNDFYRYDPLLDSWTTLGDLPAEGRVAGTQFEYNGKGYILSGQGESHGNLTNGEFWEYSPSTDTWIALTSHPGGGRWAPGSFVLNGFVYMTCGEANSGVQKDMMRFGLTEFVKNEDFNQEKELSVFPNPNSGQFRIMNLESSTEIMLLSSSGQLVWKGKVSPNELIHTDFLERGIYFCQIKQENSLETIKIILE